MDVSPLRGKQLESVRLATARQNIWEGSVRSSKLLDVETPIPVPSGWVKLGDIKPGDYVFSHAGDPVRVLAVHDNTPEVAYRLTFGDGSTIDACSEHLWTTWAYADRISYRNSTGRGEFDAAWPSWESPGEHCHPELPRKGPQVRTTQEIVDTLRVRRQANHAIPVCGPLRLPDIETPIEPYLLGAWLGDGTSRAAAVTIGDADAEDMLALLAAAGAAPHRRYRKPGTKCVTYHLGEKIRDPATNRMTTDFKASLAAVGLLQNKHVPAMYLRASGAQRLALLQGLMDTDGGWSGPTVAFSSVNRNLADGVAELARSLGQKAVIRSYRAKLNGRDCGLVWRVAWTPTIQVFRLPRKAARMRAPGYPNELGRHHRMIVDAERIDLKPMRCLTVDAHYGLFLAGESMIPTHNTVSSLVAWVRYARTGPAGNLLMSGKTERTLKRNIIDPLTEMLGPKRCDYKQGAGEVRLCGRRVYVAGANDERSIDRIKGLTLAGAYADEVSTMPQSFYVMLLSRLSVAGAQLFGTTNPEGPVHWLKKDYLDRASVWLDHDGTVKRDPDGLDLARFSFRLADNPHLPPAYVESLRREFTGLWRKRLIEGLWVVAEGAVYDMFDEDEHVVDVCPVIKRWVCCSVDYGTTNPFHALLIGVGIDRTLYVVSEWRWDSRARHRQLSDAEYSAKLREWLASVQFPGSQLHGVTPEMIVVDPSAASFRVQLFQDRLRPALADNEVVDGIRTVSSLFATGRLRIHRSCKYLIEELQGYSWDEKAAAKGEDAPAKVNDHGADALRYGLVTTRSIWRNMLRPAETPPNYQDTFGVDL